MIRHQLFIIFLSHIPIIISLSANKAQAGCQISLQRDFTSVQNEAIYLKKVRGKFSFYKPINESDLISTNSVLTLSCPGKRNSFARQRSSNQTDLVCRGNHLLSVQNGTIVNLRDLNCTKTAQAELKIRSEKCALNNRGQLYDIGFKIDARNFLSVFKICYDNVSETTYFTQHVINGAAIKYSIKESKRTNFQTDGLATTSYQNITSIYNKRNQARHFANIFGPNQFYINNSMFLARGHLTPDADFIFPNFQLATYFYVNTAPEFQIVNAGNWQRIESLVRNLAAEYRTDFHIYTGVYDVLQLPMNSSSSSSSSKRQNISIYLDTNKKTPVPKWFWKVIKNIQLDSAIVLITLNNPFAQRAEIIEFCPNVCERASLTSKHFQDIRKGYTFCCEVDWFKKIVLDLPSNLTAKSLLSGSRASFVLDEDDENLN